MSVLKGLVIAIAMYSKIPVPQFPWKDENMHYAICFFPLVGVISGALLTGWLLLAARLGIDVPARAVVAALIPLIVTGGIHLDGFMDTSDALSSWMTREKRLEILKDPHIGAFAVICALILGGLYLAGSLEIAKVLEAVRQPAGAPELFAGRSAVKLCLIWGLTFVYARALSGLSVVIFKNAKKESTLYAFVSPAHQKKVQTIMIAEAAASAVLMTAVNPVRGPVLVAGGLLVFFYYRHRAFREFGGITGDLCGWFLCLAETVMVLLLAGLLIAGV